MSIKKQEKKANSILKQCYPLREIIPPGLKILSGWNEKWQVLKCRLAISLANKSHNSCQRMCFAKKREIRRRKRKGLFPNEMVLKENCFKLPRGSFNQGVLLRFIRLANWRGIFRRRANFQHCHLRISSLTSPLTKLSPKRKKYRLYVWGFFLIYITVKWSSR